MKKLAAVFLLAWMSMQSHATTVLYKDFDALVSEAEGIVVGTVRAVESRYDDDLDIHTFVTLDDLDFVYGTTDKDSLVIRLEGGQVGDDVLEVHGSPQLRLNDRVILFLKGNGETAVPIVGWTQGVFRVAKNSRTGKQVVHDHEGNRVFGVHDRTIKKERKRPAEAHIVDPQNGESHTARAFSATEHSSHPGVSDDPGGPASVASEPASDDREAMDVTDFLNGIGRRLGQKGRTGAPFVKNADRALPPAAAKGVDAAPRDAERGPRR